MTASSVASSPGSDKGLITTETSPTDGRRRVISLTDRGRQEARLLDERSAAQIASLIGPLDGSGRGRLAAAMTEIERLTGRGATAPVTLRDLASGDLG